MKYKNNYICTKERKTISNEWLDKLEKEINEKIDSGQIKAFKYEDCIEHERKLGKFNCVCEEEAEYKYAENPKNIKFNEFFNVAKKRPIMTYLMDYT